MSTFIVRRRGIAANAAELDFALTRLRDADGWTGLDARCVHSYALRESDGRLGLACVLEAAAAEAVRDHARAAQVAAHEVLRVGRLVVGRDFASPQAYLVRRRSGWPDVEAFGGAAASASSAGGDAMVSQVAWLQSYAVHEHDRRIGSVCLYQATGPRALWDHARVARMPIAEVLPVLGRIVFSPLPFVPTAALRPLRDRWLPAAGNPTE